jgi:hypothetical protein
MTALGANPEFSVFISDAVYGQPEESFGFFLGGVRQGYVPHFDEGYIGPGTMYGSSVSGGTRIGGDSVPSGNSRTFSVTPAYQHAADEFRFVSNTTGPARIELLDAMSNVVGSLDYSGADAANLLSVVITAAT